jgi:hypothetical protein
MSQPLSIRKGTSQARDPEVAARELHAAIDQPGIKLAVFYVAPDFDLPALATALDARFKGVNLIGCTTAGEITPQGYLAGSLTGFSIASSDLDAVTQLIGLSPFDSVATGAVVAQLPAKLRGDDGLPATAADTFAFMLIDGLAMQEELVVSCVYAALQGIELIGGSAADDTRFGSTHIYHEGRFHQGAALVTLVRTGLPFTSFRAQHFRQSGKRMVVTNADPSRRVVTEINGMPAAREYARLLGLEVQELTPMIFACHPVVVRIGGQYFVRSIAKVNEDQSLSFFCAIDNGIVLTIAEGVDMVENLRQAFDDVRRAVGPPQIVFGCDCILRRLETERTGIKERIGEIFVENNVVGFATYGEQFNSMHINQTFAGIAIGSPR